MTARKVPTSVALIVAVLGVAWIFAVRSRSDATRHAVMNRLETGTNPDSSQDAGQPPSTVARTASQIPADRISCRDVTGPSHASAMKRLALAARLPDDAYTRYHEAVASAMCDGDSKTINELVDSGYLSYAEARAMQDVIASDRPVRVNAERTAEGLRFEEAWKGLRELGLCSACASDVAEFYARHPTSRCGVLATHALEGDEQALGELESEPQFCQPK